MTLILNFTAMTVLSALSLCLIFGKLTSVIAAISFLLGMVFCGKYSDQVQEEKIKYQFSSFLFYSFVLLAAFLQFQFVFYLIKDEWWSNNTNNLADLPLHINMIKAFARGVEFWPANLEFAQQELKYPFAMDFFNSLFSVLQVPLGLHLFVVGFVFSVLSLMALHYWMGFWGVAAFFLSGGVSSVAQLVMGNSWYPGDAIAWKNLFLSVFVTQRGFLFALPAGIYLIRNLVQIQFFDRKKVLSLNLLIAALPFFHLHSFFILGLYLFGNLLLLPQPITRKISFIKQFIPGIVIALLFVLNSLTEGTAEKALGFSLLWTWDKKQNLILYLGQNFLFFIPICVYLIFYISVSRSYSIAEKLRRLLPIFLFFIFLNIKMAPWAWDNIKILLWCYLLTQKEFYDYLRLRLTPLQIKIAACVIFFPGFLMLGRSFPLSVHKVKIFSDTELSEKIMQNVPVNDAVLSSSEYYHPLYFVGCKLVMGFTPHLWSFGVSYQQQEKLIADIFTGQENWQQAAKFLSAKWLYWGKNERLKYGKIPLVFQNYRTSTIGIDDGAISVVDLRAIYGSNQ